MKRTARVIGVLTLLTVLLSIPMYSQTSEPGGPSETSAAQNKEGSNQSSSEDETAQFKHSPSVHLLARITGLSDEGAFWLAVLINFAIVVGVIAWLWKKNVPAAFRNRTALIQKSIEEARRASEDANRRLSEVEARLGRLDEEISGMRALSEKEAAAEEERIKAAAAEDAHRIAESARQEIEAAVKSARRELTAYAADLAVSLATKQIRVDATADQALVRRFAQQLSDGGAPGKEVLIMATVINTYAGAFADVVMSSRLDPARTLAETQQIAELVRQSRELREVWENPSIPAGEKRGVLDAIVQRAGISRPVRNFVAVVIDKGRVRVFEDIVAQFAQELNQRLGFAEAEVTTARELGANERTGLESDLARVTGKRIRARYEQDRSILGGAIARVGSTVYDGSVKGQLERIRQLLALSF